MDPRQRVILFMSATSDIGGAENVLLTLARRLDKQRFRCLLLTQDEGPLTDAFRIAGGQVVCFALSAWRKSKNLLSRYLAVRQMVRLVRERQVDLIHCNNYRLAPYMIWARQLTGVPGLVHIHDYLTLDHIRRFALSRAEYLLTVSDYVRAPFNPCGLKGRTIHNGIDLESFGASVPSDCRREWGLPENAVVLGMVAHFTPRKRHKLFIETAAHIRQTAPHFRFVIVGDNIWQGPISMEELKQYARDKGLGREMIFAGQRYDIPAVLKALDGLALPSASDPFPLIVLEAMAAQTIVFAQHNAGGPAEQINEGQEGFLVDFTDPAKTSARITAVLEDRDLCRRICKKGCQRVADEFHQDQFVARVQDFYQDIFSS